MNATRPVPTAPSPASRASQAPSRRRPRPRARAVLVLLGAAVVLALGLAVLAIVAGATQGVDLSGDRPGVQDGFIGDGSHVSPFDEDLPAIANLKPGLRAAVQEAAKAAKADGVALVVSGGWRDEKYQRWLSDREVDRSGAKAAEGLVTTGSSSRHLTGDAVDVGPTDAAYWMQQYGADFGLCQRYNNEIWHYELVVEPGGTCPQPFLNAADRPRPLGLRARVEARADDRQRTTPRTRTAPRARRSRRDGADRGEHVPGVHRALAAPADVRRAGASCPEPVESPMRGAPYLSWAPGTQSALRVSPTYRNS